MAKSSGQRIASLEIATLLLLAAPGYAEAATASFTGLGYLNPTYPNSLNPYVDAKGTVVAGTSTYASNGDLEAFVWTPSGGMLGLGFPAEADAASSAANTISGNGQMIGGCVEDNSGHEHGFFWTQAAGAKLLNDQSSIQCVYGLNRNGSYMAGLSDTTGQSFVWMKGQNKAELLPDLLTRNGYSSALGMDLTGKYVVGSSSTLTGRNEAVIWNDGVVKALGFPTADTASVAFGISGDSTMVVGYGVPASGSNITAFYWTTASGIKALSAPEHLPYASAMAVDNDGSVIVGCASTSQDLKRPNVQAILWNNLHPKTLVSLAKTYGIDIAGWTLTLPLPSRPTARPSSATASIQTAAARPGFFGFPEVTKKFA